MDNSNEKIILDALGDPTALERAVSRRQAFGSMGNWGKGLALASLPFGLAAMTKEAFAQRGPLSAGEIIALNYALTLERMEAKFYSTGVASGVIPNHHRGVFELIAANEIAHRDFLEAVLGSQTVPVPEFDFTAGGTLDPFNDYNTFLILAQGFEDLGVRAYKGQITALQGNDLVLTAGARIHSVEARQASLVRRLRGEHLGQNPEEAPFKGWPSIPPVDDAARPFIGPVYGPGRPPSQFPPESNTVHAGINVVPLAMALTGDEAIDNPMQAAAEAFDEPLDRRTVLEIAEMFISSRPRRRG
jgi:hypothetical protein